MDAGPINSVGFLFVYVRNLSRKEATPEKTVLDDSGGCTGGARWGPLAGARAP